VGLDCTGGIVRHVAEPSAVPEAEQACWGFVWKRKKEKKNLKESTLFLVDFVTLCGCGITHGHQGPSRLKAIDQPVVFLNSEISICPPQG